MEAPVTTRLVEVTATKAERQDYTNPCSANHPCEGRLIQAF